MKGNNVDLQDEQGNLHPAADRHAKCPYSMGQPVEPMPNAWARQVGYMSKAAIAVFSKI